MLIKWGEPMYAMRPVYIMNGIRKRGSRRFTRYLAKLEGSEFLAQIEGSEFLAILERE